MTDRDLFIAALDHSDPAGRVGFLDRHCADDPERRRRVEVLLRAHDEASRFLADPAAPPGESDGPTRTAALGDDSSPTAGLDVRDFLNPSDRPDLLGTLDHYEVIEEVGRGGMGVVLKAFDPKLHRLVALKLMAPHLAVRGAARKRFEREARAVAAVRNEHVVAIHGVQTDGPAPYLVMEFVGGISLQDRLEHSGPLDVKEILRIGMQTARGLAAAHAQGIVHRDIKPANILLENGVERVKITDFGLARIADDANRTQSGVITGTPNYMSPEQAAGGASDARSDLFSLGGVLYALCTGHPPFRAETPLAVLRRVCDDPVRPVRQVNPDVPDWLAAIVHKLLAKAPADRFATAAEVADLLGQHLAHLQQPAAVPMPAAVEPPAADPRSIVRVRATAKGRVVDWFAFRQGRLAEPGRVARMLGLTTILTDVVTDLFDLARSLDPGFRFVVLGPNGPTTAAFDVVLAGKDFEIGCGRRLVRGGFPLNPLAAEFGANYDVIVTVTAGSAAVRAKVQSLLRSKYAETGEPAATEPVVAPTSATPPAARHGCLVPLAIVVAVGLLVGFRDTIWFRVVQSGFWATAYVLGMSAVVGLIYGLARWRARPGWDRRRWDAGLVVLGGCTVMALAALANRPHGGRFADALDWQTVGLIGSCLVTNMSLLLQAVRWVWRLVRESSPGPFPPAPARDLWTAAVLRAGVLTLGVGLAMTGLYVSFATGPDKAEGLAGLLAGWGLVALLVFGPAVFLTRLRWRRQYGPDGPGDRRTVRWAGLGILTTLLIVAAIVARNPELRAHLFGPRDEAYLAVHWDAEAVGRVVVTREGTRDEKVVYGVSGFGGPTPAGSYVVRGFRGEGAGWREVYLEEFTLVAGATHGISMFEPSLPGSDAGLVAVACDDGTLTITLTTATQDADPRGPTTGMVIQSVPPPVQTILLTDEGKRARNRQALRPGTDYHLTIARGDRVLHQETFRLKPREERTLAIPPIVTPNRTVELKPKAGRFPTDVTRMHLSPDRSAVAVERYAGPILVFDAATGKERFTVDRPQTHCTAFGFTPDGKRLAYLVPADGPDHVLRTADAADGRPIGKDLKPQPGRSFFNSPALAFSPDGKRLAVSATHNANPDNRWVSRVLRWDLPADGAARELAPMEWQDGFIQALRFTGDGSEVLAVAGTATAVGWGWADGKESRRADTNQFVTDLVAAGPAVEAFGGWSPALSRGFVDRWSPKVLREPPPPSPPFSTVPFASLAVSRDELLVAAGTKGGANVAWEQLAAVHVWNAKTGHERVRLLGHTDWPMDLALDQTELVSAGKDGTVRYWKLP